jgi:hypothetical protein
MTEAQKSAIPAELLAKMADPMWRISNLYKIIIKGDDEEETLVIQFKPNRAQRRFIARLHHRNIILKARQLGFTTLIAIVWLDHALFNANSRCGIIAQDREAAEVIFRDKVKFAYENLPVMLKEAMPLARDSASELLFAHNNSSIRVATSMRSGTIHRLHVSEFGKICAKFPDKAKEVITGSIPAVPLNGITVIESTAEGTAGDFHDMTQRAIAAQEQGRELTERDYRFHFFPWWEEDRYRMKPEGVTITAKDHEYFDKIEVDANTTIDLEQRAWYVATRDSDFVGKEESMWQEYPSTPKEAFQVSIEGCYYTKQLTLVRKQGRILRIPEVSVPVNTFWDIGNSDGCAIWMHQQVGMEDRFIGYFEAHGETLKFYVKHLQDTGHIWNKHFLPHDADHKRLSDTNKSIKDMLKDLGLQNLEVVPVISDINTGIQMVREYFSSCYFDVDCKDGLSRLENYKKKWNKHDSRWSDEPSHDENSEGADAFRTFAQAKSGKLITMAGSVKPRERGRSLRPVLDEAVGY